MQGIHDKITKEDLRKYDEGKIDIGRTVESFMSHNGFELLMMIFLTEIATIKNKDDYDKLEDFKADRKAIKLIQNMFDEFQSYVDESEQAIINIEKFKKAESQTPDLLSIDGEGNEE